MINLFGLALNIVGVLLMIRFALPAPDIFDDGTEIITTNPDPVKAKRAKRRRRFHTTGLTCLFIGFVMQFVAAIS